MSFARYEQGDIVFYISLFAFFFFLLVFKFETLLGFIIWVSFKFVGFLRKLVGFVNLVVYLVIVLNWFELGFSKFVACLLGCLENGDTDFCIIASMEYKENFWVMFIKGHLNFILSIFLLFLGKQNDVNPLRFTAALKGWTCLYKVLEDKLLWIPDYLWVAEDGMKMQVSTSFVNAVYGTMNCSLPFFSVSKVHSSKSMGYWFCRSSFACLQSNTMKLHPCSPEDMIS